MNNKRNVTGPDKPFAHIKRHPTGAGPYTGYDRSGPGGLEDVGGSQEYHPPHASAPPRRSRWARLLRLLRHKTR